MMKFLFPEISWNNIKAIGFDMDGTLYDEFDFIYQVYLEIANQIFTEEQREHVLNFMLNRWLEKGSSYPYIFSEALNKSNVNSDLQEKKIKNALMIFRNFQPSLQLSVRMKFLLEYAKKKYEIFLVSDGSSILQWNKIEALQLLNFFRKENIFISGDYGKGNEKPSLNSLNILQVFTNGFKPKEIVFVGDRIIDKQYAENAGFNFININYKLKNND